MTTEGDFAYLRGEIDKLTAKIDPLLEGEHSLVSRVAKLEDAKLAAPARGLTWWLAVLAGAAILFAVYPPERVAEIVASIDRIATALGVR